MKNRIEFNMHSYWSRINGTNSAENIFNRAKDLGMDTIAITNIGSVKDLRIAYNFAKRIGIKLILGMEAFYRDGRIYCETKNEDNFNRIVILAKDVDGKKKLYKLISEYYKNGYAELKNRESLLIGLSTSFSNIIGSLVVRQSDNKILEKIKPFDFILVTPHCYHKHNERILSLADRTDKLVIASNSPYYLSDKDAIAREALRYANNKDPDDDVDSILYSTDEMMDAFSYLGDRAKEVVVDNGYKLADMISDDVPPIPNGSFYFDTKQAFEKENKLFGSDNVIKFGYMSIQVNKSVISLDEKHVEDKNNAGYVSEEEQDTISERCADAFLKTRISPGSLFIIPIGMEIEDFTPIEYVEDDKGNRVAVTHIDCNDLYDVLFSTETTANNSSDNQ